MAEIKPWAIQTYICILKKYKQLKRE